MDIQSICHVFLILFGGFFAFQLTFNSKKFATDLRLDSPQVPYALKPAGFLMGGTVLMLIATLPSLQIGGLSSTKELIALVGVYSVMLFIWNMGQHLKIWSTPDGRDYYKKNTYRPLIFLIVVLIYFYSA